MTRKQEVFVFCVLLSIAGYAQEEQQTEAAQQAWKYDGMLGINATATGMVNWNGGGNDNASALAYAKFHLLYHKDGVAWETNFDTDFGLTWIDQEDDQWKKSSDKIKFVTKFGWEFQKGWYLTALGGFQSQYTEGREYKKGKYDPVISNWLTPSRTDLSLGIDWKTSVNGCDFSVYMSPVAGLITTAYVSDAQNKLYTEEYKNAMKAAGQTISEDYVDFRREMQLKYGTYKIIQDINGKPDVDWRSHRAEFGFSFKGTIAYKYKDLTLGTTLGLYTPYREKGYNLKEAFEKAYPGTKYEGYYIYSNLNRHFGLFDVDWDFNISYRFLKVMNVTFSSHLKYFTGTLIKDKDGVEKERVQFKSILGLGVGYSF